MAGLQLARNLLAGGSGNKGNGTADADKPAAVKPTSVTDPDEPKPAVGSGDT